MVDGYIANEDGILEWLESTEVEGDSGYNSLLERSGTVVMGTNQIEKSGQLAMLHYIKNN